MSTKLGDLLNEAQIILNLGAANRWEAIEEMVTNLIQTGNVKPEDRDAIVGAVRKREFSMSTGIGYGVGIPHASSELVRQPVAAFGRSKKKIEFDSLDGKPVSLVILFLIPRGQIQQHLHTMSGIARLLQKPELREALESAPDAATILRLIKEGQAS
ncbi:MAG TPA: PTS sugar transporter subunit IIA [Pseudomonadales bacterium]|nr:PTS sugar transporter subunit IIA [Pseudomonadales bacterium]